MGKSVAVLGGGIGGLTAAHELLERGFEVTVYELKTIPGGKSRTLPATGTGVGGRPDLPGEHGFRFIPAFYRHLPDSMKRIPFGAGNCYDNLTPTSLIEIAQFGGAPVVVPSRLPRSWDEVLLVFKDIFDTDIGLLPGELEFFARRIWQVMTSCDERRLHELEAISWWEFVDAENRSPAYQRFLAEGLSRSLVAANAKEGSARTIGQVQVHLLFGQFDLAAGSTDRVLDGPTSPQLLLPWIAHIEQLGGRYLTRRRVRAIDCVDGRISGVQVEDVDTAAVTQVVADYYVCAMPVEVMGPLISDAMVAVDPSLANIRVLDPQVRWMNGIQFFLRTDVPVIHGHVLYVDSPWAITSISEAQFWKGIDLHDYGDGTVSGILSVDISDWQCKGYFIKEFACDLRPDQIADEVWQELKLALNQGGQVLLRDQDKVGYFLDTDIEDPQFDRPSKDINLEPLFINTPSSWGKRPQAGTGIENLVLASDYVQTNADLACMDSANEAGRRAVNALLDRTGSAAPRCQIWDMGMPELFLPFRMHDQERWDEGLPWDGGVLAGDAGAQRSWLAYTMAMARHARGDDGTGTPPAALAPVQAGAVTPADDAFHIAEYRSASHLFWYTEWWYFNWVDPKSGRSGMVTFSCFNPTDIDLMGVVNLNAAIFDPQGSGITVKMDYHGISEFWASAEKADVTLAGNTLQALDANTYEINATSDDGSVSMALVYTQADAPQVLANNVHGSSPWEVSSWLAYMPSARVNGWVSVNGERIELVEATGYHDHDWGIWFLPGNVWAWAAFSDPSRHIAFDVGLHAAFQKSVAYFRHGDLRLCFPQESFSSSFSDWEHWKVLWKYPKTVTFSAIDSTGQYKAEMTWRVTGTAPLWKYPLIVFEQAAQFTGTLSQKSGEGWEKVVDFDVPGFCEYTMTWTGDGPS
ncbi:NAD-binding domain and a Fe-S cluster-containing protein [Variovorax sp. HW608]|uniref:FAD-dependent oxidoreductase n=1 Tax=Variovorax sp. HW608 TaxID=1034889 RepID=UPI00082008C8|nr:FAD-dependent oxidoreductase [Variovorax sp. HW608]SCK30437.1 NAD-binding domain and a Fe-S cluster-containing protein [Variovorax sp. HW608]